MRNIRVLFIIAAISCLCSSASLAQQSRPLTVWADTIALNVCDPNTFTMPIWVGTYGTNDTITGFRREDTVVGVTLNVSWDISKIDFVDYTPAGTLGAGDVAEVAQVIIDSREGRLQIRIGNPTQFTRPIAARGRPLIKLIGRLKTSDTINGLDGWVQPLSGMSIESETSFTPQYLPGFVRVIRDTTPAYTGTLSIGSNGFDTLRSDTVTVALQNVRNRKVREVAFTMKADSDYFSFIDTIETGTLAGSVAWASKEITLSGDAVTVRFVSTTDLTVEGALLRVVIRRSTDSSFSKAIDVEEFKVNAGSCLGKLGTSSAEISAEPIRAVPTMIDGSRGGDTKRDVVVIPVDDATIVIKTGDIRDSDISVYDIMGRNIQPQRVEQLDEATVRMRFEHSLSGGFYIMALRGRNEIVNKQFILIK